MWQLFFQCVNLHGTYGTTIAMWIKWCCGGKVVYFRKYNTNIANNKNISIRGGVFQHIITPFFLIVCSTMIVYSARHDVRSCCGSGFISSVTDPDPSAVLRIFIWIQCYGTGSISRLVDQIHLQSCRSDPSAVLRIRIHLQCYGSGSICSVTDPDPSAVLRIQIHLECCGSRSIFSVMDPDTSQD